jgi:hypothetical protein
MIDAGLVKEILSVYKKHGWTLRRVLLSDKLRNGPGKLGDDVFEGITPAASVLDGLWFSRPSKGSLEAWELRHLSTAPYALVEVMDVDLPEHDREAKLRETELRMQKSVNRNN